MLRIEFSRKADKFLDKCEKDLCKRLVGAIQELQESPFPKDAKRVENQWFEGEKIFRIRIGDYRVLYCVDHQKSRIMIVNIDKRERVY
ncbi:MAG TPA: type II toxin-antitoxin system RelE/ParE family toxin [Candidatus Nanoarchaeia archaeon]|nr:type II toxin-antitoxin system RelE/ParE family toxin [Candidatus Nanoarchaeia archaeon]